MSMSRWDPFRDMMTLRDSVDRVFEETFGRLRGDGFEFWTGRPALNMFETDTTITIEIPLPGVKLEDVTVTISNGMLTIKGERRSKEELKDEQFIHREVRYGSFERSVLLPDNVDVDNADAEFEDGVLHVKLPKTATVEPKRLEIKQPAVEEHAIG